ncbi:hypothetical protein YC2023_060992 [Brassica napus]
MIFSSPVYYRYTFQLSLTSFSYTAKHQTFTISPIFDERQRLRVSDFGGNGGLGDDLNGGSSTQVQSKNAYPIAKISMLMLNTIDRVEFEK